MTSRPFCTVSSALSPTSLSCSRATARCFSATPSKSSPSRKRRARRRSPSQRSGVGERNERMPESTPPTPSRFDPWSGNRYGGARWFAFSTAFHVGLLLLFATITLTVLRKTEEIRVKVVDDAAAPEELDGAPSTQDLAGVLKMEKAVPQHAAPSGPTIQGMRAPEMPRIGGVGPKLGSGPTIDTISTNLSFGSG